MKVKDIMSYQVQKIDSDAMITDAAKMMKEFDIGILPVQNENEIVGMITDRDIVIRVISERKDPSLTTMSEAMTLEVICCSQEEDIEEAAKIMEYEQVHRILVLDNDNSVAGILSLGDIALKTRNEHLAYEVLEKICEPTHTS